MKKFFPKKICNGLNSFLTCKTIDQCQQNKISQMSPIWGVGCKRYKHNIKRTQSVDSGVSWCLWNCPLNLYYWKLTFPMPQVLVGVLTDMKIRSASVMAFSISVEKNKLRPLHSFMTASRPGCKKMWIDIEENSLGFKELY